MQRVFGCQEQISLGVTPKLTLDLSRGFSNCRARADSTGPASGQPWTKASFPSWGSRGEQQQSKSLLGEEAGPVCMRGRISSLAGQRCAGGAVLRLSWSGDGQRPQTELSMQRSQLVPSMVAAGVAARNYILLPLSAHHISVNMTICCFSLENSPASLVLQMMTALPKPHLLHLSLQASV